MKFATPIFDGASLAQIKEYTDKAGIAENGQTYLHDGGTGERFDQPVSLIDIAPTLLALADLPIPAGIEGVDLSELWRGGSGVSTAAWAASGHRAFVAQVLGDAVHVAQVRVHAVHV